MARPFEYRLDDYADMILDASRPHGYVPALRRAVRSGCAVLDIGTGTGFFALLACQFGASRVYAIEPGEVIHIARELAAANGCADRIVFIQDVSTRATLPERVDIVISDLHGAVPLFEQHIPSIADARERFLKPDGVLIPGRETVWAAPVAAGDLYERYYTKPWSENAYGLNLTSVRQLVVNSPRSVSLTSEQAVAEPRLWATLDYATVRDPNVKGELRWTVDRPATAHGLALWFDADFDGEASISNAPGMSHHLYAQMFLPFRDPIRLAAGDALRVDVRADLAGNDYTWQWRTRVLASEGGASRDADVRQSTFFGERQSLAGLRKREAGFRPALDAAGEAVAFMLSQMNGEATLEDIARRAREAFPEEFADFKSALTRAGDVAGRYSR